METFILILVMHVSMGEGQANALSVAEFNSKGNCEAALKSFKDMYVGLSKKVDGLCVKK